MESSSDRELIRRLQSGDLNALGALYDRHHKLVYRTALGITGDAESASDLLQDIFLRLHRFADKVDPERPLEPWLYRVSANLSCTFVKRRRWMKPIEEIAEWFSGGVKNLPAQIAEDREEWQEVRQALDYLPLPQRTVIVMYYINDLSIQEIAESLDIPLGTVKSRLYYGRKVLKKQLSEPRKKMGTIYEFT